MYEKSLKFLKIEFEYAITYQNLKADNYGNSTFKSKSQS